MWYRDLLASRVYPGSCPATRNPRHKEAAHAAYTHASARSYSSSAPSSPRRPSPPSSPSPPAGASRIRHRYVTELIQSAGAVHRGHHSRYHRFFSNAAWSIDDLYEALAREAIATFYPEGTIELGVDDTLCRKRGLDDLRHRDAPRPADLQPQAAPRQLGTRLGDPLAARAQPALVPDQGLGPAGGHAAVPQPPGADQGQEGPGPRPRASRGKKRPPDPEPPHPPRTGRGADPASSRSGSPGGRSSSAATAPTAARASCSICPRTST